MAKLLIKKGSSSKLVELFIQDNSVTTGEGLTGLTFSSAGLAAYYYRDTGGSAVSISLVAGSLGTWSSGGFVEVDSTNMPGMYQLGLPNTAIATGATGVIIELRGATNMAPSVFEIQLAAVDPDMADFGLTNISSNVTQWLGVAPNALISGKVDSVQELRSGLTQSGSTASTIKLDAGASATDSFYNDGIAWDITTGQSRRISAYVGSTKVATISPNWQTTPGTGDTFVIIPFETLSATVSGTVDANVITWLGSTPASLTTNGYLQTMLLRWLTDNAAGTPDALSTGKLPADVKLWLASAPSSLNAGLVQTDVERWLNTVVTAVTAGIPDVNTKNINNFTAQTDTSNLLKVDVEDWRGSTPDVLSSGKIPSDLKLWLGAAPASLTTNGYVQGMLLRWLTDNAAGTPDALFDGLVQTDIIEANNTIITAGDFVATVNTINTKIGTPVGTVSTDIGGVKTDTTSILARLGAFTGTGLNTVLGFFRALLRKDAALTPSDVGGTYDNTTMSLEGMYTKIIHIPEGIEKNVAYPNFKFIMRSSSNHITPTTLLTVTAQRSIDSGAFAACTNAVVEISDGAYKINLSASDLNGTSIMFFFSAPGADSVFIVVKTV